MAEKAENHSATLTDAAHLIYRAGETRRMGMSRTATIRQRVEPRLKDNIEVPNAATKKAFEATDRGEGLKKHESLDQLFETLDKC